MDDEKTLCDTNYASRDTEFFFGLCSSTVRELLDKRRSPFHYVIGHMDALHPLETFPWSFPSLLSLWIFLLEGLVDFEGLEASDCDSLS